MLAAARVVKRAAFVGYLSTTRLQNMRLSAARSAYQRAWGYYAASINNRCKPKGGA